MSEDFEAYYDCYFHSFTLYYRVSLILLGTLRPRSCVGDKNDEFCVILNLFQDLHSNLINRIFFTTPALHGNGWEMMHLNIPRANEKKELRI